MLVKLFNYQDCIPTVSYKVRLHSPADGCNCPLDAPSSVSVIRGTLTPQAVRDTDSFADGISYTVN